MRSITLWVLVAVLVSGSLGSRTSDAKPETLKASIAKPTVGDGSRLLQLCCRITGASLRALRLLRQQAFLGHHRIGQHRI